MRSLSINKAFVLWAIVTGAFLVGLVALSHDGLKVETNILKLLPQDEVNPQHQMVLDSLTKSMERTVVFLVQHAEPDSAFDRARILMQDAATAKLFSRVSSGFTPSQERQWFDYYYPQRTTLLPVSLRKILLADNPGELLYKRECELLFSPIPDYYGKGLQDDPLMLFSEWAQSQQKSNGELEDSLLYFEDDTVFSVLITAELVGSPFDAQVQRGVENFINVERFHVKKSGGELVATGIVRYAGFAFQQAKQEASIIGTISILGVILVVLFIFQSFKSLIIGALPIGVGLLFGTTAGLWMYGSLHVITITMAGCLTGVAVDYSFHYLADRALSQSAWNQRGTLRRIFSGITLGAITTILGYAAFFLSPLPGLRQIAVVSVFGMLGAWFTVVCAFPYFFATPPERQPRISLFYSLRKVLQAPSPRVQKSALVVLGLLIAAGIWQVRFDDRVDLLRSSALILDREEMIIRHSLPPLSSSRFLFVEGDNDEEVLQRLEQVGNALDSLVAQGKILSYWSVAHGLPSEKRRQENRNLLKNAWESSQFNLPLQLQSLGFTTRALEKFGASLQADTAAPTNQSVQERLQHDVFRVQPKMWVSSGSYRGSVILLEGDVPKALLDSVALSIPHVKVMDRMARLTDLLMSYRQRAMVVVIFAYFAIGALLVWRYGVRKGITVLIPPILAALSSVALLGLLGYPLNLFHIIGLLLVLGIGIDYTIFYAEGEGHSDETTLAVILAALSTLLAFGVLIFSVTPALKAIGLVIVPGITISLLLAKWAEKK